MNAYHINRIVKATGDVDATIAALTTLRDEAVSYADRRDRAVAALVHTVATYRFSTGPADMDLHNVTRATEEFTKAVADFETATNMALSLAGRDDDAFDVIHAFAQRAFDGR